jgi:hypothetical protein
MKMMNNEFCIFILTHGRPDRIYTYKTLIDQKYTGKIYIVIDNEDKTADKYYKLYGDKVIMFDKKAIAKTFDEGDNFNDRRAIIYARNVCFDLAEQVGCEYFMELDDDYTDFRYKHPDESTYTSEKHKNLDKLFSTLLEFYKNIPAAAIAIAQGGDYIGGKNCSTWSRGLKLHRKCMNSFICSTKRRFQFVGRINEDVNTYTCVAGRGALFLTIPLVALNQKPTQSNAGGMTDLYLDSGTYIKSFYTVMYSPSCCKVNLMGDGHERLHHSISWNNAVPVILDEKYKKLKA